MKSVRRAVDEVLMGQNTEEESTMRYKPRALPKGFHALPEKEKAAALIAHWNTLSLRPKIEREHLEACLEAIEDARESVVIASELMYCLFDGTSTMTTKTLEIVGLLNEAAIHLRVRARRTK